MIFVPAGTTQLSLVAFLCNASTRAPVTGKVASTFSLPVLSLIAGQLPGTITLSNLAGATSNFSAGGIFELGSGRYRIDVTMSGAAQVLTICAEGTVGQLVIESVVVANSASMYGGTNTLALNGSGPAAANLSNFPPVTTTSPMFGVTVVIDNGTTTKNSNVISFNGSAAAASAFSFFDTRSIDTTTRLIKGDLRAVNASGSGASALSFATNDTNNWLQVSGQLNGVSLFSDLRAINGDTTAPSALEQIARLIPGQVTVQSPVISSALIRLVPGDDYFAADQRSLDFTFTNIPDITNGTVSFNAYNFVLNGSIQSATTVRFEPTSTQTAKLAVGTLPYAIVVILADGHTLTLCTGIIDTRS